MGGRDPYSNSKGCAELVTTAYRESYFPPASFDRHGVALASARAGNAIGGGDWTSDQLIPDLMRGIPREPTLPDSKPIRIPALAVRPGAAARIPHACRATRRGRRRDSPPAGTSVPPTRMPSRCPGLRTNWRIHGEAAASWSHDAAAHPREAHVLKLDASKAKACLDWHPRASLARWPWNGSSSGIELSSRGPIFGAYTQMQIERYEALAQN